MKNEKLQGFVIIKDDNSRRKKSVIITILKNPEDEIRYYIIITNPCSCFIRYYNESL